MQPADLRGDSAVIGEPKLKLSHKINVSDAHVNAPDDVWDSFIIVGILCISQHPRPACSDNALASIVQHPFVSVARMRKRAAGRQAIAASSSF
jgi:hypothetical protein